MSRSLRTLSSIAEASRCIAGPSRLPQGARYASTQVHPPPPAEIPTVERPPPPTAPYPFSSTAVPRPSTSELPVRPNLLHPKKGWSIIQHLNTHLRTIYDTASLSTTLFARKSPERLRTGSIITVITWNGPDKSSTTSFSGILIATRHRGIDTTFRVRNVVSRIGVEYAYKCCSPLLKEVRVVRAATGRKGPARDLGHRKAYWIRNRPEILARIAAVAQIRNK